MPPGKMHADEVDIDDALVARLVADEFPEWKGLPVSRVESSGTDNAMYRLGDDLSVRLPRRPGAAAQVEKEQRWLPYLAPYLPLDVPLPVGMGTPAHDYPFAWSVCRWLDGEMATIDRVSDVDGLVRDLTAFIHAMQAIDAADGPAPGEHNFGRGVPLAERDATTRRSLEALGTEALDADLVLAAWEASLHAPPWDAPPVWIHGDLQPGNLLVTEGRLTGVIDFGGLGVGDPACELLVAWNLVPAAARPAFREALGVDDATWLRGRGWALSMALIALPYYLTTNPRIVRDSWWLLDQVLTDFEANG